MLYIVQVLTSPAVSSPSKREFSQLIRLGFWITVLSIMTVGNIFTNIICLFQWPNSKGGCQKTKRSWSETSWNTCLVNWLQLWPWSALVPCSHSSHRALGVARHLALVSETIANVIGTESLEKHSCGRPCSLAALGTLHHVSEARLACWMRKWFMTQLFEGIGVIIFSSTKRLTD